MKDVSVSEEEVNFDSIFGLRTFSSATDGVLSGCVI